MLKLMVDLDELAATLESLPEVLVGATRSVGPAATPTPTGRR